MKVLITGGAGFIGSAMCRHVVGKRGWSIAVIDKLTYAGHLSSLGKFSGDPRVAFIRADICDRNAVDEAFSRHRPDAVIHLAAESHVDRSITHARDFVHTNIVGTATLLDATRAYLDRCSPAQKDGFRFLHVSTDEVYGSLEGDGYFTEATPYEPRSPYAASKAASDHLARAWGTTYGIPVILSHCSNNYGPYQLPEKLIPLAILNAMELRPLPVYGDGLHVRDWLHVEEHVQALLLMLERGRPGECYNVGGRSERTNLHVVQSICDILDRKIPESKARRTLISFVPDRPGHDRRYAIDSAKIETELRWRPQGEFEAGLERTVEWYLGNREWWEPIRAAGHGTKRLGLLNETSK
ncbi:MAG: dTDP-glucose 4,6-dehydratase [Proteobacteria bacterium]|nr:dTDP-glucose 4,6-dehydratase [Pseudomonadota bacterium]